MSAGLNAPISVDNMVNVDVFGLFLMFLLFFGLFFGLFSWNSADLEGAGG